jgi:type I restriction enzyme, R subunit
MPILEDHLEQSVLDLLQELGYSYECGYDIAPEPDGARPERDDYKQVWLPGRLRKQLTHLNPHLPPAAIEDAISRLGKLEGGPVARNRQFHKYLRDGVPVEYSKDGEMVGDLARLADFENWQNNDWLCVNQFTIIGPSINGVVYNRRPDIILFLNGLPIAVIELKNPAKEKTDIWAAFGQLQTYKEQIPDLFETNEILVIADGATARFGSLTADKERFMEWRIIEGHSLDPLGIHKKTETLVRGLLAPQTLLSYIRDAVLFEDDGGVLIKKIAGFHQFRALKKAYTRALEASAEGGDRKGGVVWHTQGSGKSITMALYAGRVLGSPQMKNPTVVVITDRIDLDDQLWGTFGQAQELLRVTPEQADGRDELRTLLQNRPSGGVVFTTIQKFLPYEAEKKFPVLSERSNIVVICDEAHRTQYGIKARLNTNTGALQYGYAKHMRDAFPNATFTAFTGTPVSLSDRDTRGVFGEYIDIYDMQMAQDDGATVPILYESRLVKLEAQEAELPSVDEAIDELLEESDETEQARLKSRWAALAQVVGAPPRLEKVARDFVAHYDKRQEQMDGKVMLVCMSREICVHLYNEICRLRPEWHHDDPKQGAIKVIMTGSASDEKHIQRHVYPRLVKKEIEKRFKDAKDELKIVIVRDMWLTGFDVPPLHTIYLDKPMRGHTLMQAIARVNRVFKDKPGGLVVDYIGIANELKAALQEYTDSGAQGQPVQDVVEKALPKLHEHLEVARGMMHGFDYSDFESEGHLLLGDAADHVLGLPPDSKGREGKERFGNCISLLSKAFTLCGAHPQAMVFRDEIAWLEAVNATLNKVETVAKNGSKQNNEGVIRQLMSRAIASEGVQDLFAAVGLERPNIGVLSEAFLRDVRGLKQKNVAVELLERLLRDEIRIGAGNNVVQNRKFSEKLRDTLVNYHNRAVETAQVIEELIAMAREFNAAIKRDEELGLSQDEIAFYDALADNEAALREMSDETLRQIALELTSSLRRSVSVDWAVREAVRAKIRLMVKRILRKYKYPPEQQENAIDLVLRQAETLSAQWASCSA